MYNEQKVEDIDQLFSKSIVRYKGLPVYCFGPDAEKRLRCQFIHTKEEIKEFPDSPDFDFKPIPLGMFNSNNSCCFLQRIPKRQYKIGLTSDSISGVYAEQVHADKLLLEVRKAFSLNLFNTFTGNYPSIEEVLAKEKGVTAFSRVFAISHDGELFYKAVKVGMINGENGKPIFTNSKKYLHKIWET